MWARRATSSACRRVPVFQKIALSCMRTVLIFNPKASAMLDSSSPRRKALRQPRLGGREPENLLQDQIVRLRGMFEVEEHDGHDPVARAVVGAVNLNAPQENRPLRRPRQRDDVAETRRCRGGVAESPPQCLLQGRRADACLVVRPAADLQVQPEIAPGPSVGLNDAAERVEDQPAVAKRVERGEHCPFMPIHRFLHLVHTKPANHFCPLRERGHLRGYKAVSLADPHNLRAFPKWDMTRPPGASMEEARLRMQRVSEQALPRVSARGRQRDARRAGGGKAAGGRPSVFWDIGRVRPR